MQAPSHTPVSSSAAASARHHPFWSAVAAASGRRGKWITLIVWIAIVAAISPFAGKLSDVEENDAAAWLPEEAESLQVEQLQAQFSSGDPVAAVIGHQRTPGRCRRVLLQDPHGRFQIVGGFQDLAYQSGNGFL